MNKLVLAIKLMNTKSNTEKILLGMTNDTTDNIPDSHLIDMIINEIKDPKTREYSLKIFLDILKKQKEWLTLIKILYIAHICIIKIGEIFINVYLAISPDAFHGLLKEEKEIRLREYLHRILINAYHRHILELARNYDSLKECKMLNLGYAIQSIKSNDTKILKNLLNMSDVLKSCLKLKDCVVAALAQKFNITKMIGALLLQDCVEFYNIISKVIVNTIAFVFEVQPETAILLDALYTDLIKCTKLIKEFEIQKSEMIDINIPHAELYQIDFEFNKAEEKYIENLQKLLNPKLILNRPTSSGSGSGSSNSSSAYGSRKSSKLNEINNNRIKLEKDDYMRLNTNENNEEYEIPQIISPMTNRNIIIVDDNTLHERSSSKDHINNNKGIIYKGPFNEEYGCGNNNTGNKSPLQNEKSATDTTNKDLNIESGSLSKIISLRELRIDERSPTSLVNPPMLLVNHDKDTEIKYNDSNSKSYLSSDTGTYTCKNTTDNLLNSLNTDPDEAK